MHCLLDLSYVCLTPSGLRPGLFCVRPDRIHDYTRHTTIYTTKQTRLASTRYNRIDTADPTIPDPVRPCPYPVLSDSTRTRSNPVPPDPTKPDLTRPSAPNPTNPTEANRRLCGACVSVWWSSEGRRYRLLAGSLAPPARHGHYNRYWMPSAESASGRQIRGVGGAVEVSNPRHVEDSDDHVPLKRERGGGEGVDCEWGDLPSLKRIFPKSFLLIFLTLKPSNSI